jgi:hypothetical protein
VQAKCALALCSVRGIVADEHGAVVDDATVMVFLDEEDTPLSRWDPSGPRAWTPAGPDGAFEVNGQISTFSGYSFLTGDRCNRRIRRIVVLAQAPSHFPRRVAWRAKDLVIRTDRLEYLVELPRPIVLDPADP